jgi:hypothetical protein
MQLLVHKNISFCLAQKRYQPGKSSGKKPLKLIKTTPSTNIQPTFVSCETKWGFPEIGIPPNHPFQ